MSELRPRGNRNLTTPPIARHGRLHAPGPVATLVKYLAVALTVAVVSVGAVAGYAVWNIASSVKPGVKLLGETEGPAPDIGSYEGGVNLLLVGSDSGQGDPAYGERGENLNDVTILLHIAADHSNATVVSFPRDLVVRIPSCPQEDGEGSYSAQSSAKINVALAYGGLACAVQTVSELTGLDIPFAAKIEFNGVIEMSNAIGGVTVCVASAIHDGQIGLDLEAGQQPLSGWNALMFLRSRYGIGGGTDLDGTDLARISNQQVFMSALVRQVKNKETLSDPLKLYGLAKAAVDNMEVSNSLRNPLTLASIAFALKDIPAQNIQLVQYPSSFGSREGIEGVLPITDAANALLSAMIADLPVTLTGTTGGGSSLDPTAPTPVDANTPTLEGAVALPESITGQSSAQQTCSMGQSYVP